MPAPRDEHECKLRRRFDNKRHAETAALRIAKTQGKQRLPESCRFCSGYHLSDAK